MSYDKAVKDFGSLEGFADGDDLKKMQGLKSQMEAQQQFNEFDTKGKSYYQIQTELKKIQANLNRLENGDIMDSVDDTFSQERKDAALWFDRAHGGFRAADDYFDPPSKAVYSAGTNQEKRGFCAYTLSSGGHNRPLAGFEKPRGEPGTGWEERFYKEAKQVWIDYEGKGDDIRGLTSLIEKSTYPDDIWLQSGQDFSTLEGFLKIPYGTLSQMTDSQLQQFVGRREKFY